MTKLKKNSGVLEGPYVNCRGTGGTKMSENADFITVETYTQQEKTITTSFSYIGQHVNKIYMFGYLGGGGGPWGEFSMIRLGLYCSPVFISPISMYM